MNTKKRSSPKLILANKHYIQPELLRFILANMQARSQDLEKGGGGFFERVRKVQTTLTRIFNDLESVSHGLSKN